MKRIITDITINFIVCFLFILLFGLIFAPAQLNGAGVGRAATIALGTAMGSVFWNRKKRKK